MSDRQEYKRQPFIRQQPTRPQFIPPVGKTYFPYRNIDDTIVDKLFLIVQDGDYNKIREFITDNGITLNIRNKNGESVLHKIIPREELSNKDKLDLIKFFLDNGAPINALNKSNVSALHLASKYSLYDVVKLLLSKGADVKVVDNQNMNAVHYLVESISTPCKKIKKVKSLIPKPSSVINQRNELKELTVLIIDILSTNNFNMYIKHIKNSLTIIPDIYVEYFLDAKRKYHTELLSTIANTTKTEVDKHREIESKTVNLINDIKSKIKDNLNITLTQLAVLPSETDLSKLEEIEPISVINKLKLKFIAKNDKCFSDISKEISLANTISIDIRTSMFNIYNFLTQILIQNRNLEVNAFPGITPVPVDWNELKELYLFPNISNPLCYPDLNISGEIPIKRLIFPSLSEQTPVHRGTSDEINRWQKDKIKPLTQSILTDDHDVRPIKGPDVTRQIRGRKPINLDGVLEELTTDDNRFKKSPLTLSDTPADAEPAPITEPALYAGQPIYYTGILKYVIEQIMTNIYIISFNNKSLIDHISNTYHYDVYHRLSTNMIYSIFNILQNITLILQYKNKLYETTRSIKSKFNDIINDNTKHPYFFSIQYAIMFSNEIIKELNTIYAKFDSLYSTLMNMIDKLNDIIKNINDLSAITYMEQYYGSESSVLEFIKKTTRPITNIYDRILLPFDKPNISLEEYHELYGAYDPTDEESIDVVRKQLYEKYAPKITKFNYSTYLSDKSIDDGDHYELRGIFRSDFPNLPTPIPQPIKAQSDINPQIGYLINNIDGQHWKSISATGDAEPLLGGDPELTTDMLTDVPLSVISADDTKVGNLGYKFTIDSKYKVNSVYPSIGRYLDTHLNMIKYQIVKYVVIFIKTGNYQLIPQMEIINRATEIYNNMKDKLSTVYNITDVDYVISRVVSYLTDELIINIINQYSQQIAGKYTKSIITSEDVTRLPTAVIDKIIMNDNGYELNLNVIFDVIINQFMTKDIQPTRNTDYNTLKYSSILIDDEIPITQFPVYNSNYLSTTSLTELRCYKTDSNIINLLKQYHADINGKDANQSSPIFYAINMLHTDLVKELILNGAIVNLPSVKNKIGLTPFDYTINSYKIHNQLIGSDLGLSVLENICAPYYKELVDNIQSKQEYQNNIIKYLNTVFPQLVIMYNNMLSHFTISYFGKWSFDKHTKLTDLFVKYGVLAPNLLDDKKLPILNIDLNLIYNNSNLHVLKTKAEQLIKQTTTHNEIIDDAKHKIDNIEKEIKQLNEYKSDAFIKNYIDELQNKKTNYLDIISNEKTATLNIDVHNKKTVSNLTNKASILAKQTDNNIRNFIMDKKYLNFKDIASFYQNIFDYVVNSNDISSDIIETGQEDVRLYNEMWLSLIKDNTRLHHSSNLHIMCVVLQSKLINNIKNKSILNDIQILKTLYNDVFIKLVKDYTELPQEYNTINYMLTNIIDVIVHIVKYTICNSLYLAIIKNLVKYIQAINPKDIGGEVFKIYQRNPNKYDEFVKDTINSIIDFNYGIKGAKPDPKLQKYLFNILPIKIVKYILKIYSGDEDEDRTISSIEELFEPINIIIKRNTSLPITDESSIIKNLEDIIYPYYKDLLINSVTLMKVLIDNYNSFILNEGRYLEILDLIINKALSE